MTFSSTVPMEKQNGTQNRGEREEEWDRGGEIEGQGEIKIQ